MPDQKPADPVLDPIPLKDLVQSFAATVAATSHNLDLASVELRNLYQQSGNATLAMMLPPRFVLDEVTIDLSFVVTKATPDVYADQLPDECKKVGRATLEDADTLRNKLAQLAKDDAIADAQDKKAKRQAAIKSNDQALQNGQAALQKARTDQTNAQKEQNDAVAKRNAALQAKPPNPQNIASTTTVMVQASAKLQQATAQVNQLNAAYGPTGTATVQINRDSDMSRAAIKTYDDKIASPLGSKDPLTQDQIDDVRKAGIDYKAYDQMWDAYYKQYVRLRDAFKNTTDAFQAKQPLPRTEDFTLSAEDQLVLNKIAAQETGWKTVQDKVQGIRSDYAATQTALGAIVQLVASAKGSGLLVRVDPKGLADAPQEARQKMHLRFHTQVQQNVKVGDQDVAIGG